MYLSFNLFLTEPHMELLFSAFFVTLSIYTFNKKTDVEEDRINTPERLKISTSSLLIPVAALSYIFSLVLGGIQNPHFVVVLMVPLFSGLLYSTKVGNVRVKDIFFIKNLVIATSCSIIATMPFFYHMNYEYFLFIFTFFFIKLLINTVIFDIRDVEGDRTINIKTVPVKIGVKHTKMFLYSLNTCILGIVLAGIHAGLFGMYYPVLLFSVVYAYCYIHMSDRFSSRFMYDFVVDGEWTYLAILVFLINLI
ncbi:MAG TPA: prenyltransferase [Thermoplasmatales archaeon]|nr:MAG: prenyltransferase [Thermoplasmata archaeon]RLF61174.1 MAG: prenyltransferase [Thermoplasmata archaeon]HDN50887.1 prenyltransferase [Thermoplasmatales archaeon]